MSRTSELLKQKKKEREQTAPLTEQTVTTGGGTTPAGSSRTQQILSGQSSGSRTRKIIAEKMLTQGVDGYNSWLTGVSDLSKRLSDDYTARQGTYQSAADFKKYRDQNAAAIGDYQYQAGIYRDYFNENASLFDEEAVKNAQEALTQYGDYLSAVRGDLDSEYDYWAQFEDEAAYTSFLEQQERNAKLSTFDLEGGRNSLAEKEAQLDEAKKAKNTASTVLSGVQRYGTQAQREEAQAALDEATAAYEAIQAEVTALERDIYDAETLQKGLSYNGLLSAADFGQYSGQGAAIKNPALSDVEKGVTIFGGEKPGNIVTYSRDNWETIALGEANNSQMTGRSLYHYMTDDEVNIYNYLLAKEGADEAQEYLDYLEETLNYRFGTAQGENIRGTENGFGRTLATGLYGFGAGLDQWASGTRQLFSKERLPTTATQYGSAYIREDLADSGPQIAGGSLGQMAYEATNVIGNMAPSILVAAMTAGAGAPATATKIAGAVTMGSSSAGNAYNQKLAEGYSAEKAGTYAALVGASEAGLQYLLGGISAMGGVTDDILLAKVAGIDNALARVALTGSIKIGSEISEEELQLWLEPAFESLIFGTEYDAPTFEDMAYTAIVTALSTGLLESGSIASAGFAPAAPATAPQGVTEALETAGSANVAQENDVAGQLIAAGATEEQAQQLAPIIRDILDGKDVSGNQAGAIAKNEAAVSILETVTGEAINTDAPLGEVKTTIRSLASRQNAQSEQAAAEDTPAQVQPVEAVETAPTAPTMEAVTQNNVQAVADFAKTMEKAGAAAMTQMYDGSQSAEQYVAGMMRAYNAGKNGTNRAEIINDLQGITGPQAQAAYIAGQADAAGVTTVAKTNKADYTIGKTTNKEGLNNGTEEVYLRESGQWDHGANSGRGLRQLEESAGRDPGWQAQTEPADSEATNLSYGRKVSSADLGIDSGVDNDAVYLVTSGNTAATRAAQAEADKRGLKLVLFGGGDIHSALAPDGANGYVDETTMYVRADDPDFTADQIARHEGGHDMIRKGEVDIAEVRSRIEKIVGGKGMVETAAELYAWAYEGSSLTPEQVWEECICDSLGDMNIFAGALDGLGDFVPNLHETLKSAVAESTRAPRGPPANGESKASRRKRSGLNGQETEEPGKLAQNRQGITGGAEKAGLAGIDGRGSGSGGTGSRADQVQYQDLTKYEQERVSELLVTPVDNCPEWAAVIRRVPISTAAETIFDWVMQGSPIAKALAEEVPGFAEAAVKVHEFINRQAPKGRNASASRNTSPSGEYDTDGGQLTVAQAEFFKNSKLRDANGRLLALYHGSRSEAFSVFDLYEGVWLTPDRRYAEIYAENWHSWRDDMSIGLEERVLNGLEPEIYTDPDLRLYKMYANGEKLVNLGELDGPLTEEKVRELARKLGVKAAELRKLAEPYMDEYTYSLTRSHEFMELAKAQGFDSFAATESGRETYCIFASPDQVALTTNKAPSSNPDVRYSRRLNLDSIKGKADEVAAALENYHAELNREYRALEEQDRQFKETAEYQKFLDTISKSSIKSENLDKVVADYSAWEKTSGYGQVVKDMEALRGEMKTVLGRLQRVKERAAKEAQKAYRALYNEEFSKKYASKAARKFGTTSRFDLAGYLTVNGSLLDFSERQGYRVQDHREIAEVLDFLPEEHGYSDGLIEFMNMGNIRMQSYGIDISQPPNAKQTSVLRRFFAHLDGEVTVDFSRENGDSAGSIDYAEGTRPDKILRDIDYFFKNGEVPEQSDVARFHGMYSRRLSLDGSDAEERFAPEFYSKMERAVEAIKGNKIGASSVVPYLAGRGIKAEEIKWSGLSSYLDGKKSVNRDELLAYLQNNRLEIQEEVLEDEDPRAVPYTEEEADELQGLQAVIDGQTARANELWREAYGEDLPAALLDEENLANAITREIIDRNGGQIGFVGIDSLKNAERELYIRTTDQLRRATMQMERLEGRVRARKRNTSNTKWNQYKLDGGERYREYKYKLPGSDYTNRAMQAHWEDKGVLAHARVQDFEHNGEPVMFVEEIQSDWHNAGAKTGYGRLISEYRNQEVIKDGGRYYLVPIGAEPDVKVREKDLRERWGDSRVDSLRKQLIANRQVGLTPAAPYAKTYHEYVLKSMLRKAAEGGYAYLAWSPGWLQEERWSSDYAEGYRIEYDQDIPKFLNKYGKQWGARTEDISLDGLRNTTVHAIPITDEMRGSVLYEGQPKFSRKIVSFDDLREENRLLKDRLDELKGIEKRAASNAKQTEYWKGQTKRTTQPTLRQEDVDKLAKRLIHDYDGTVAAEDIAGELKALGEFIMRGGDGKNELTWTEVKDRAVSIARDIAESAEVLVDDGEADTYREIRSRLRKQRIAFNDQGDIADYGDFRKRNFGRLNLKTNGRTNIDGVYEEMSEMWPEFFDSAEQTHPTDQLMHIVDVLDSLRPVYENPFSYDMATALEYVSNDIIDGLLGEDVRQTPPTFADRQAAKLDSQKAKDRQKLDRLRAQKNERIAEIRKQGQERTREALRKVRADRDAKIKDLKARYRAKDAKARESRRATALRAKIQRHVKELNSTLLRPSDKHHVPEALRGPVARLLEAINLESNYELEFGRDAKYHRVKPGDSLYAEVTKRTQAFAELRKAYAEIAGELVIDPDLLGDNGAPGLFDEVAALADKPIAAMNTTELETIWQTIRAVEASIRSANKMFAAARFQTVSEAAEALRRDNDGKKAKTEYNYIGGLQKLVGVDMLTPEAFLHRLGDSGDAIFRMMRSAQDEHIRIMKAVADFTHEALNDVNVRALEKELHTVTLGGEEVKLSTAQLMELYALMRREQAQAHILAGGILPDVVSTKGLKKITKAEPIRGITLEEVSKALSLLTAEQTAIAEKLQDYASTTLSDFGNKASMAVYNYKKFTEEHYWPIRSNRQETKSTVEKDTATTSVANRGFTKATKPNANTSVKLGSIFDTFSTHASEMATYAAWLGTTEDVNRIRNFTFRDGEGNRTGTVKGIFDRVHGSQGSAYLQKLLSDIANGVKGTHGETEYMGGLVGNYKAASVGANLRVIIQQPTAILRALDMIAPQYLAAGIRPGGWKKALRYAPIAQWKDWGYFDINTGRQMKDVLFDSDSKLEKVKQASMWMAGKMDSFAWGQLWNAVETETKARHKELKPGTREFYDAVAARFTEIIDRTQVVDGILQRSQIMRSGSGLTKMATAFMGEPTKQYNMLLTSAYDASHATSKERRTAAKKRLARTVFALSVSGVVNAAAQSIMDAVRDDDKEKDYWDKWLSAFTGFTGEEEGFGEHLAAFWSGNLESIINPAQYVPYAKDVVSILQGYDVSRMDMESIEKTISAAQNMLKALNGEGKYTLAGASANLFAEGARLLGIPVANFKREVKSFAMLAAIESDNYVMQYYMEKTSLSMNYSGNSGTFMDILYNAFVNDREAYELIYADMVESGFDPEKIKSGMETRMKADQGVTKAEELDSRYLSPEQQTQYDRTMRTIRGSSIWDDATAEQQDKVEGYLYDLIMGNSDGAKMQEKIDGGAEYGIDETDYLLYKLALSMVDEPTESGKYGSYTNDEVEAAIKMLGLDDEASGYLRG